MFFSFYFLFLVLFWFCFVLFLSFHSSDAEITGFIRRLKKKKERNRERKGGNMADPRYSGGESFLQICGKA